MATITGTISDQSGLAIPSAKVVATHLASNYKYEASTNEVGLYTLGQLREGAYRLEVGSSGFRSVELKDITLAPMNVRRVDVTLEVGTVEAKIEVTASTGLIETETARISDTKGAELLKVLPLNARSLWNFVGLNPGVAQATSSSSYRRFSGSRLNQSDASLDGITTNNGIDGGQISPLVNYIESYDEVRVDMANNTAEFSALGQVTIVSRSGTNQLKGTAFDYYQTPFFRARNPFALERATGVRHQPGYSIGGPIYLPKIYDGRNRTFFFHSYENTKGSQEVTLFNPTVAPLPWRSGDFSNVSGLALRDPEAGAPFPGNRIPASRLNPVAQKIQSRFFPAPNFGDPNAFTTQNYRELKTRPRDAENYVTARIDHRFSNRSSIYGRYTYNRALDGRFEGALPTIGQRTGRRDTRSIATSHTFTVSPNLLQEFRWGYAFNDSPRRGAISGKELVAELGLQGLAPDLPDTGGVTRVNFSNIGLTGIAATENRAPGFSSVVHQFQDHVSYFRGRHTIKAGFALSRVNFREQSQSSNLWGNLTFSNRFTNQPYADFLLGIPTSTNRAFPALKEDSVRWTYDFFVTDEFKLTPRLTLNLGMRYELHPALRESSGYASIFDPSSGKIVIPDGSLSKVSPLMPKGYVDVVEASTLGYPSGRLLRVDKNNWAPRIGLAYRPWGPNTVVRAGFGVFYDTVPRSVNAVATPFALAEPTFTNPTDKPTVVLPQVFPSSAGGLTSVSLPEAMRPDMRIPLSMQYNITIEHERWNTAFRLSYIGTNTRQGEYKYNLNQPLPDNRLFVDKPRMFPRYPGINYVTNGAGHQYNAFTVEAKRRLVKGLQGQVSWNWARDIGDLERGESPENAYDRRRERAVWVDVPTHRVSGNFVYELPFGRGRKFFPSAGKTMDIIVGGWEISGIYTLHTGQFLTPQWTGIDPTGTAFTSSRTPAQVTIRPNILRDANLPSGDRSVYRWFDVPAFGAPTPGFYGTSAKGVIKGPGINVWQAGVYKRIAIQERVLLRLELTSLNILNHPNYSAPGMNITAPASVGIINDVGGVSGLDPSGARALRAGVRVEF